MKYAIYFSLLFALVACGRNDADSYSYEDSERTSDYQSCRQYERASLRWKAMAQCERVGWGKSIGGGCGHLNPLIPGETDGEIQAISTEIEIREKIEKALAYCEIFKPL